MKAADPFFLAVWCLTASKTSIEDLSEYLEKELQDYFSITVGNHIQSHKDWIRA